MQYMWCKCAEMSTKSGNYYAKHYQCKPEGAQHPKKNHILPTAMQSGGCSEKPEVDVKLPCGQK